MSGASLFFERIKEVYKGIHILNLTLSEFSVYLLRTPLDARLKTHKLKGKLEGTWACSVAYDCRLVFEFIKSSSRDDDIFLIEIGTHEEVY